MRPHGKSKRVPLVQSGVLREPGIAASRTGLWLRQCSDRQSAFDAIHQSRRGVDEGYFHHRSEAPAVPGGGIQRVQSHGSRCAGHFDCAVVLEWRSQLWQRGSSHRNREHPARTPTCIKIHVLMTHWKFSFLAAAAAAGVMLLPAQPRQTVDPEQRLKWWTEARFGMFIHWGIYTVPAGEWNGQPVKGLGEWIMNRAQIPVREYEKLASQFNPVKFNADAWVAVAKNAGMKYLTITAKHHDGFAMFGSKVSPYNIVDATPFHRDPMKELAGACQRAGIKLCFYYSQTQDWHERGGVGNTWDFTPPTPAEFEKYYNDKVIPQVRELLTNYGPIGLIWFDTPRDIIVEQSQKLADLVHELQPNCLVSGRVGHGLGDYDSAGDNQISMGAVKRPWETPVTLNDTWGFKKDDHNWKPAQVLIRQLATTSSRGGNYLLNVGPTSQGVIPPESVERLAEVGKWMKVNGESIYGTAANPFPYELPWGVITSKPSRLYLHVFRWPSKELVV